MHVRVYIHIYAYAKIDCTNAQGDFRIDWMKGDEFRGYATWLKLSSGKSDEE